MDRMIHHTFVVDMLHNINFTTGWPASIRRSRFGHHPNRGPGASSLCKFSPHFNFTISHTKFSHRLNSTRMIGNRISGYNSIIHTQYKIAPVLGCISRQGGHILIPCDSAPVCIRPFCGIKSPVTIKLIRPDQFVICCRYGSSIE